MCANFLAGDQYILVIDQAYGEDGGYWPFFAFFWTEVKLRNARLCEKLTDSG